MASFMAPDAVFAELSSRPIIKPAKGRVSQTEEVILQVVISGFEFMTVLS